MQKMIPLKLPMPTFPLANFYVPDGIYKVSQCKPAAVPHTESLHPQNSIGITEWRSTS